MKVASYNVMSGGFNSYNYEDKKPQRLNLLVEAVKQLNADFVSLIDTFRWDDIYSENDLKSLFGYKHVFCINLEDSRLQKLGHNTGITVMTNEKVVEIQKIRLNTRNGIKSTISKNDKKVDLFSIYLDDLLEETRIGQIKALLPLIDKKHPTILMGDWNTLMQKDVLEFMRIIEKAAHANPIAVKKMKPFFNEIQKGIVIKILEENGFHDLDTDSVTTVPTPLFGLKDLSSLARLDYIFGSDNISGSNFKVYKDNLFDMVSDHYPVTAVVEF